jgi:hypothetical protein
MLQETTYSRSFQALRNPIPIPVHFRHRRSELNVLSSTQLQRAEMERNPGGDAVVRFQLAVMRHFCYWASEQARTMVSPVLRRYNLREDRRIVTGLPRTA